MIHSNMHTDLLKQFFTLHVRLIAVVIVVVGVGGAWWYISSNLEPVLGSYAIVRGTVIETLNEPGTVIAENNANLSFQESGQIAHVYVKEGDVVDTGAALADLNSASLEANLAQANAALVAAQAKLQALQIGATPQAIAVSQSALTTAQQTLANTYAGVSNTLADAYTKSNDAVRNQLVAFFSNAETNAPQLTFNVTDSQAAINTLSLRVVASSDLDAWQIELTTVNANSPYSDLDAALQNAASSLPSIKDLMEDVMTALTAETGLSASTLTAYNTSAEAGLTEVNAALTEVSNAQQSIASEEAVISQAQAQLNLTTASSTPQTIQEQQAAVAQAQAAVTAAQVAVDNASLLAPFSGTVQDLTAQVGQVVSPGTPVLSLVNNGGLKIQAYVSEADVTKVKVGDKAAVTLDAFGTGTAFPATITTIDSAETQVNGVPSYLVTLHFTTAEPQVKDGMTGNVQLAAAEEDNVIAVPNRFVLNNGNQYFVLVKTPAGTAQQPVQIGLVGDNMTEITSGLNENDTLANF